MIRQTIIAFWLIPAEPAHSLFQGIINDLSRRFGAPAFEPHLTIHVEADRADLAEPAVEQVARECELVRLKPLEINQSDEFIKTLFVEFGMTAELRHINEIIRDVVGDSLKYELKPHLSLLYNKMPAATRRELAASITVPCSEIGFDSLKAVRCVSPTQTREDVEAWRVVRAQSFRHSERSAAESRNPAD